MSTVVIDAATRDKMLAVVGDAEVRDEAGELIGTFHKVAQQAAAGPRVPGLWKGQVTILSDDDDHLADFAEYMLCQRKTDYPSS